MVHLRHLNRLICRNEKKIILAQLIFIIVEQIDRELFGDSYGSVIFWSICETDHCVIVMLAR